MRLACAFTVFAAVGFSTLASAQEGPYRSDPPPARVGFQMALRTGYSLPMGKASGEPGDDMSESFGGQVPLFVEIGGKPHPNVFVGGYFGLGFGRAAGRLQQACDEVNVSCTAFGVRLGAEVQYHILPGATSNPWLGYGIGYESTGVAISVGDRTGSFSGSGIEFAHFMGGVDFRLSRVFGIGPVVDLSLGQYSHAHAEFPGTTTQDTDIQQKAMHEWLTLGVRGVFFP